MFGTDDKYNQTIVYKRWQYVKSCLEAECIKIVGQSTDGDKRSFKEIRIESELIYGHTTSVCGIEGYA